MSPDESSFGALTAALAEAIERGALEDAAEILRRRGRLLEQAGATSTDSPQAVLAVDAQSSERLLRLRDELRGEIDRLRRARAITPAFEPARRRRRRLSIEA